MTVRDLKKIDDPLGNLSLDFWWTWSAIIEYLDCRRYGENGKVWTFDFDKAGQQDNKTMQEKKVVIPGYTVAQNIRPNDLTARFVLQDMGLPTVSLKDADFIPEGPVNTTGFPVFTGHIDDHDPKLAFANKALVRDSGLFYQWDIGNMENYYKNKPNPLDSSKFFEIVDKLSEYQKLLTIKQPDQQLKTGIEDTYKELEKAREKLRQKILEYHDIKKPDYDTSNLNAPTPPRLSYFDSIKYEGGRYHVKTHMEPVFFRSAIRSLNRAEDARRKRDSDHMDHNYILDEIEYSAACIVSAVNCLESYINFVINEHLSAKPRDESIRGKWRCVPKMLKSPFEFDENKPPYSDFSFIIDCRRKTVHYESGYDEAEGEVSKTYNLLNVENARTAVRAVRDMVTTLSEEGKIPLPTWIKSGMKPADYWDEVTQYLGQT